MTGPSPSEGAGAGSFAIVIAVHNGRAFIERTLDSIRFQTRPPTQVIVVDDGSSDGSGELARAYGGLPVAVERLEKAGVSAARNRGLALATSGFVLFLDADDLLEPDALERLGAALTADPAAVAAFGHHLKIDEADAPLESREAALAKPLPARLTLEQLLGKNLIVNGGALAIRTEAARRAGGFDTALRLAEDWEFWCRLACLGDFAVLTDRIVLNYRIRLGSANFSERKTSFPPRYPALDVVFSNPDIIARIDPATLRRRRRAMEIEEFWTSARNEIFAGRRLSALKFFAYGAVRYPDSLMQPAKIARFSRQSVGALLRKTR